MLISIEMDHNTQKYIYEIVHFTNDSLVRAKIEKLQAFFLKAQLKPYDDFILNATTTFRDSKNSTWRLLEDYV